MVDPLTIVHVDFDNLLEFPNPTAGWTYTYHSFGWSDPYWGYLINTHGNKVTIGFAYKR
jgi:hypothetical protein